MILEPLIPQILSIQRIPYADKNILLAYGADPEKHNSLGLITCDQDDSLYVALDEATKQAPVDVVFAQSFYAGSAHSSGKHSGEILGVIAASDPDEIDEGIKTIEFCLKEDACFYSANDDNTVDFFPHVITSLGHYLSKESGLKLEQPMAYLVAPPIEGVIAADRAIKSANVKIVQIFPPPTKTNYSGIWLTGEINDCEAAAEAYAEAVIEVTNTPK